MGSDLIYEDGGNILLNSIASNISSSLLGMGVSRTLANFENKAINVNLQSTLTTGNGTIKVDTLYTIETY